jgi:hypothetical protein
VTTLLLFVVTYFKKSGDLMDAFEWMDWFDVGVHRFCDFQGRRFVHPFIIAF